MSKIKSLRNFSFANLITMLILVLSFAFPLCLYLGVINFEQLIHNWQKDSNKIAIFLSANLTEEQINSFKNQLASDKNIKQVELITKEQALIEFANFSGLNDIPNLLENNPLPTTLLISPQKINKDSLTALLENIRKFPEVDSTMNDLNWILQINAALTIGKTVISIFTILFLALIFLAVINAIRLKLARESEKITILKLLGAPDLFIQKPFVLTGLAMGLSSAGLAAALVYGIFKFLSLKINSVNQLYALKLGLINLDWPAGIFLLACGAILGTIAAWCSTTHYLRTQS